MDHVGANVGGIAPDEINHLGDIPYALIRIPILFLVLAWVAVLLRIYARAYLLGRFGKDDWTMMLAVVRTKIRRPKRFSLTIRIVLLHTTMWSNYQNRCH